MLNAQSILKSYLLTGSDEFLETYRNSLPQIGASFDELKKLTAEDASQYANMDTLRLLILQRTDYFERGIDLQHKRGSSLRLHKPLLDKGRDIQDRITVFINRVKGNELKQLNVKNEVAATETQYTFWVMAGGTILSLILLVTVFYLLDRTVNRRIHAEQERNLRDELEQLVKERTAEIGEINRKLSAEIQKQKRTEKLLKELETDFRGLFESARDAMIIYNPHNGQVFDANDWACRIYQIPREKFVNFSMKSLFKNLPEGESYIKRIMDEESPINFQTVHYKGDGTEMLMEINAVTINFEGQKVILSINRDITDRVFKFHKQS